MMPVNDSDKEEQEHWKVCPPSLPSSSLVTSPGITVRSLCWSCNPTLPNVMGGKGSPKSRSAAPNPPAPLVFPFAQFTNSCKFLPWLLDTGLGILHHQE